MAVASLPALRLAMLMDVDHYIPDHAAAAADDPPGGDGAAPAASRRRRLAVGAGLALAFCGAIAAGTLAMRPAPGAGAPGEGAAPAPLAWQPTPRAAGGGCATCGTVESVRAIGGRDTADAYRMTIRMDDGSYRTIPQPRAPGIEPGAKVRIVDAAAVAGG
ncbi:MAG: hypothetical protein M5U08_06975 [Burkholderiales bacterium]|nr:hypothetical protein [Burkholderiales bacterium]